MAGWSANCYAPWVTAPMRTATSAMRRRRWDEPLDDRFVWRLTSAGDPLWHARVARDASRVCDVFLSTNSYLTVILNRIPSVAMIYDLVVFESGMAPNRRSSVIEHLTLGGAVRQARGLVCISRATADALLRRYPGAAAKVAVAPLAVAPVLATPAPEELEDLPAAGFRPRGGHARAPQEPPPAGGGLHRAA